MKPYLKLLIIVGAALCIAAVGNIYYSVLPGLQIKHPITGAITATINGTNGTVTAEQLGSPGFTVANLPIGVASCYQTYCTDCLTPWGVGDWVEWNGTAWFTLRARIGVTTAMYDFMKAMHDATWQGHGKYSIHDVAIPPGSIDKAGWAASSSGTGASASTGSDSGYECALLTIGTAVDSYSGVGHTPVYAGVSNINSVEFVFKLPTAPNGTDNYTTLWGFSYSSSDKCTTRSCVMISDPANYFALSPTIDTNYWNLYLLQSASSTGVVTSISQDTSMHKGLMTIMGTSEVKVWVDDVLVATGLLNIPADAELRPTFRCMRSLGSATRATRVYKAQVGYYNVNGWVIK